MDKLSLHTEWLNRPEDQRFLSMQELHAHNLKKRADSKEQGVALNLMKLIPSNRNELSLEGAQFTNWSFNQFCQRVKAPAGYLRSLPSELAAIPLQWSLEHSRDDAKLYMRQHDNHVSLDAVTSETYGRIYDAEMTDAILANIDLNTWKIPSASYASSNPKRATTLYASDRDCFVCLVNDAHPIEFDVNGQQETLFRGFICRNSEVGACTLEIMLFLYRRICDNRIIHGMQNSKHFKIRHTAGGPMRFMREAKPALQNYIEMSTDSTVNMIKNASNKILGETENDVSSWLQQRGFTKSFSKQITEQATKEPGNPRSLWNIVNAITDKAHSIPYGDERIDLEKQAGKLLELA